MGGAAEKEEDGTPSQLLSSKQQGSQAVVFKISVRYAACVAAESMPYSGEPMIKSSKTKWCLNKAK